MILRVRFPRSLIAMVLTASLLTAQKPPRPEPSAYRQGLGLPYLRADLAAAAMILFTLIGPKGATLGGLEDRLRDRTDLNGRSVDRLRELATTFEARTRRDQPPLEKNVAYARFYEQALQRVVAMNDDDRELLLEMLAEFRGHVSDREALTLSALSDNLIRRWVWRYLQTQPQFFSPHQEQLAGRLVWDGGQVSTPPVGPEGLRDVVTALRETYGWMVSYEESPAPRKASAKELRFNEPLQPIFNEPDVGALEAIVSGVPGYGLDRTLKGWQVVREGSPLETRIDLARAQRTVYDVLYECRRQIKAKTGVTVDLGRVPLTMLFRVKTEIAVRQMPAREVLQRLVVALNAILVWDLTCEAQRCELAVQPVTLRFRDPWTGLAKRINEREWTMTLDR